jgi:hypothetical protein
MKTRILLCLATVIVCLPAAARIFHVDPVSGKDTNDGASAASAWKSLQRASAFPFQAGDSLLLKRGSRFADTLELTVQATAEKPFAIGAYGEGAPPVIDSRGFLAGVHLLDSHHVTVRNLEITSDGGPARDRRSHSLRYGVYLQTSKGATSSHITLENLTIHAIFPAKGVDSDGRKPTTHKGTAIAIHGSRETTSTGFVVKNCRISRTGFKAIELRSIEQAQVLDNRMKDIGGPAIQPGRVNDLLVRGNVVDGSGSSVDPRMHGRGSGIWPWTCERVLIEENKFMHARGKADSCGVHIDFNCRDVVVQYNLSHDNEGGFIEILGNNHNCAYRYNISINDGARQKKKGAHQEGKILWTSGYVGRGMKKHGPYNSYIYNNTIYVGPDSRSCFSVSSTTEGLLIANNMFHIMGRTENVLGDQDARRDKSAERIPRSIMRNNLFLRESILPPGFPLKDTTMLVGDPKFANPGSEWPKGYVPTNIGLIKDRGITIPKLPGDEIGLRLGLEVKQDFFGNPITGKPDLGAIEVR